MIRLLVFALLTLMAGGAFADTVTPASLFQIPSTDQSVAMLRMIFGNVGAVLPGQENAFNFMFKSFNEAMLVLSVFIVGYTTFFGLINTAHEGEFLGKKLNSVWVPIRSVLGVALLVPTKTGYCVLQILMMWIVLQGVGAADTVWNSALEAVRIEGSQALIPGVGAGQNPSLSANPSQNGVYGADSMFLLGQSNMSGGIDSPTAQNASQNQVLQFQAQQVALSIFKGLVCAHTWIQKTGPSSRSGSNSDSWVPPSPTTGTTTSSSGATIKVWQYNFNPSTATQVPNCGGLTYPQSSQYQPSNPSYYQAAALENTLPMAINLLNNSAIDYVYNNHLAGDPLTAVGNLVATQIINQYMQYKDYNSNVDLGTCNPQQPATLSCASLNGWSYAGAYYRVITTQSGASIPFVWDVIHFGATPDNTNFYTGSSTGIFTQSMADDAASAIETSAGNHVNSGVTSLTQLSGKSLANDFGGAGAPLSVFTNWIVQAFVAMLTTSNSDLVDGQYITSGTDPVEGVQHLGENIVNVVELIWFALILTLITGIIIAGVCPGFNPLYGVIFILLKVATFFLFFFGIFLGIGLVMSVYIPLVPFLIFFFGVMGWLMAVIETMLAAPMVAIGICYPEGHEIMGRADPAVMLVTDVFIRPTLMIFGLVGGILLADVALTILNSVYQFVALSDANNTGSTPPADFNSQNTSGGGSAAQMYNWGIGPFQLISYILIYVIIIIVIINKAFALIHQIPDQILRWIGGHHGFGEYTRGEDAVQQRAQGATEQEAGTATAAGGKLGSGTEAVFKKGMGDGKGSGSSSAAKGLQSGDDAPKGDGGGDAGAGGGDIPAG